MLIMLGCKDVHHSAFEEGMLDIRQAKEDTIHEAETTDSMHDHLRKQI